MADITDTIGLGVWVPGTNLKSVKEDDINYLMLLKPDKNGIIRYSFTSGGCATPPLHIRQTHGSTPSNHGKT